MEPQLEADTMSLDLRRIIEAVKELWPTSTDSLSSVIVYVTNPRQAWKAPSMATTWQCLMGVPRDRLPKRVWALVSEQGDGNYIYSSSPTVALFARPVMLAPQPIEGLTAGVWRGSEWEELSGEKAPLQQYRAYQPPLLRRTLNNAINWIRA